MVGTLEDVGTLEVIEVLERLDFDTPCHVGDCDNAAEWVGRPNCCSCIWLTCAEHRKVVEDSIADARAEGLPSWHVRYQPCGRRTTVVIWTPLDGAS